MEQDARAAACLSMRHLSWDPARRFFLTSMQMASPLGRVTVELFDDVPVGSLRFYELAEGHEGISYQLSKFNEVGPVRLLLDAVGPSWTLQRIEVDCMSEQGNSDPEAL